MKETFKISEVNETNFKQENSSKGKQLYSDQS